DEDELKLRVDELRGHISETYRLHRRTIRHRRSQVLADRADSDFVPYEVRGRELPRRLTIESPADERIQEILEEWRTGTRSALLDMGIEDEDASYAQVYGILMSRSGVSGRDLLEILRLRVEHVEPSIDLDPVDRGLLTFPPVLAHEPDILCAVEEAVAGSGVIAFEPVTKALLSVLPQHRKMIAFCGGGALADDLAAHLRARFPKAPMFRHTRSMAAEDAEKSVTSWRDAASGLLVCDDSGEDGLNLQQFHGQVVVQVEQRRDVPGGDHDDVIGAEAGQRWAERERVLGLCEYLDRHFAWNYLVAVPVRPHASTLAATRRVTRPGARGHGSGRAGRNRCRSQ
ncbi:MAG TPA: hypothetical protein VF821_12865, partial [Lentzea sp.]